MTLPVWIGIWAGAILLALWIDRKRMKELKALQAKLAKEIDDHEITKNKLGGAEIRTLHYGDLQEVNADVVKFTAILRSKLQSDTSPFGVYTGRFPRVLQLAAFLLFDENLATLDNIRAGRRSSDAVSKESVQ